MNTDFVSRTGCPRRGLLAHRLPMALLALPLLLSACGSPSMSADVAAADAAVPAVTRPGAAAHQPDHSATVAPPAHGDPLADADNSAFARMLEGFFQCRYESLYVSDLPGKVATAPDAEWFRAHPDAACGRDDDFYYFCMNERYHGLDVQRVAMPGTGGLPSVALYLKQDPATARLILKQQLGSDFPSSPASDAGTAPELIADPADAGRSILVCTRQF